jgi:hypothetical protein
MVRCAGGKRDSEKYKIDRGLSELHLLVITKEFGPLEKQWLRKKGCRNAAHKKIDGENPKVNWFRTPCTDSFL